MKKTLLRLLLVGLMLMAFNPTPVLADGTSPRPAICPPWSTCLVQQ